MHKFTCVIPVPPGDIPETAIRKAAGVVKLDCKKLSSYPGGHNFEIGYTDPSDLIRLGVSYQSLIAQS